MRKQLLLITLLCFCQSTVYAHSGRTNKNGCHGGSKPYHCHNGGSSGYVPPQKYKHSNPKPNDPMGFLRNDYSPGDYIYKEVVNISNDIIIEGFVVFTFDILKNGKPSNIKVARSSPDSMYTNAALESLQNSLFLPDLKGGDIAEINGNIILFRFTKNGVQYLKK